MTDQQKAFILALADLLEEHQVVLVRPQAYFDMPGNNEIPELPDCFGCEDQVVGLRKLVEQ